MELAERMSGKGAACGADGRARGGQHGQSLRPSQPRQLRQWVMSAVWVGDDTAPVSVECLHSLSLFTCGLGERCLNVAGFGDFWSRWIGDIQVASEATGAFF